MMAARYPGRLMSAMSGTAQRATLQPARLSLSYPTRSTGLRHYSSDLPPPPLLAKLKGDLKTAMKAKDAARLAVLRGVISATLNASKTASPIKTDAQLVSLLRKTQRTSQDAVDEFKAAGRDDLAEKEQAQIEILKEYANDSGVEAVGEEDLKILIEAAVGALASAGKPAAFGEVMKVLLAPGGPLDGKSVEKAEVAKVVKELVAAKGK